MSEERQNATADEMTPDRPAGRQEVIEASLQAAADLFAENNPSQVSVREIARCAGVSHALVHRYLGSKDDIFRAVVAREEGLAREFWANIDDVAAAPSMFAGGYPVDRYLRILLRAYTEGIRIGPPPDQPSLAGKVLRTLEEYPIEVSADEPGFDPRLLLLTVMATAASLSLAHDFFIERSNLSGMDRETFHSEFHRLMLRILSLAAPPE